MMQLFLDSTRDRSMSDQLYDQLAEAIASGRLVPGTRLMPTRAVAADLGVSRSTVTGAYMRLVAEGYVEGRRGGGSIVLDTRAGDDPHWTSTALRATPLAAAIGRYESGLSSARYDLTAGRVDHRLFPLAEWKRSMNRALTSLADRLGRYGDPAGDGEVRAALAHWVARSRAVAARPEQIVITRGAAHAIDLVARTLLSPGDVAAVEEPGYPPVIALLRLAGADVVGVPVDRNGIVVDAIPENARLVYVTPSHQYPLGAVLSRERRHALLRWARRRDAGIIEDDYDSEFRYSSRPLEPLQRLDGDGRVVYVGTFSKVLSPALRLGFAVLPIGLVPAVTAVRRAVDFVPPAATAAAMGSFIESGALDRHLRRARREYATRYRMLRAALSEAPIGLLTALPSDAGLHITAMTPDAPSDEILMERALERGLQLSLLHRTYQFSEPQPGVVLGFGAIAGDDIPPAIHRLVECLRG
ncbi:PLP-dependent aminotransferase family protein [Agromyces bauzanensis]|uniref:GntR family transcriptional regulator n=2 Tax=Agromyces bauzanensis TaxID=1308924 RepID=A0A917UW46_9MICO|nr:PLP-dependent aminotransferase family protein [Agromyces bauzanensis]GGJ89509.1 GntR family transcriptional regulator [Agromyces bauzanensis]